MPWFPQAVVHDEGLAEQLNLLFDLLLQPKNTLFKQSLYISTLAYLLSRYNQSKKIFSVHDKFHRILVLSGFFFLKIASTFLNSSFFPKPIKRRIAI